MEVNILTAYSVLLSKNWDTQFRLPSEYSAWENDGRLQFLDKDLFDFHRSGCMEIMPDKNRQKFFSMDVVELGKRVLAIGNKF